VKRARLAAAALALTAACGYRLTQGYRATGGVERIHVAPFENLSTEPELGAAVTAALRDELSRRGADAGAGAPAVLDGEVRAMGGVPSSAAAATFRVGVEARARLVIRGEAVAERTVRREGDYLGGADALETEGRRAVALRRLAGEVARELVRGFEAN
jgi:outer membrane lipopolysaccharide assembly protein LptE/RlpB